jgi:hypothetical protein
VLDVEYESNLVRQVRLTEKKEFVKNRNILNLKRMNKLPSNKEKIETEEAGDSNIVSNYRGSNRFGSLMQDDSIESSEVLQIQPKMQVQLESYQPDSKIYFKTN